MKSAFLSFLSTFINILKVPDQKTGIWKDSGFWSQRHFENIFSLPGKKTREMLRGSLQNPSKKCQICSVQFDKVCPVLKYYH